MTTLNIFPSDIQSKQAISPRFVRGVDTLRFFAAMWVVFSHGARFPLEQYLDPADGVMQTIAVGISKMAFNGTAAVAIFFIISGFCIHYPNVGSQALNWRNFLCRRMVRIGVPLVAVLILVNLLGPSYADEEDRILWSVYCEVIYYALYPALFWALSKWGITRLLAVSALISGSLLVTHPSSTYLWEFGLSLTWLFCAPLWLAGAWLAELHKRGARFPKLASVWIWRAAIVFGCGATTVLAHHLPLHVGYTWTIPIFAVFCLAWLSVELGRWEKMDPSPIWEVLGAGSYSIYLMHKPAMDFFRLLGWISESAVMWSFQLAIILAFSYAFFFLVEKPSHNLARKISWRPSTALA